MIQFPQHIAIIPDGNRRWAEQRGTPAILGHREGANRFYEVAKESFAQGIPYFTFWVASEDNLRKRSKMEVSALVLLFRERLQEQLLSEEFLKEKIRVRVLGSGQEIVGDAKLDEMIQKVEKATEGFSGRNLTILFGYNGTTEMLTAIQGIAEDTRHKTQDANEVRELLRKHLWTGELPPVDFVIRTGMEGDPHNSAGFMMWQTAESQLYFTETFWPDFGKEEFAKALEEYGERERRLGK